MVVDVVSQAEAGFINHGAPLGIKCLGFDSTVWETLANRLPPALDDTVRAADNSDPGVHYTTGKDCRQCFTCSGARPVPHPSVVANANSHQPLRQIRKGGFPVNLKGIALWNRKLFCLPVLVEKLLPDALRVLITIASLSLSNCRGLIAKSMIPYLCKSRADEKL